MVVDPALATACMENYTSIMQGSSLQTIKDAFTESVSFSASSLKDWLDTNDYLNECESFDLSFGIYTQEAATELDVPEGRITTFIWPIKTGEDYAPFNIGTLRP